MPSASYFDTINVAVAAKCPENCSTCLSLLNCLSCAKGYLKPTNSCGDCPERYFSNNQTKLCVKCPYDCGSCDESGNCLSCNPTDYRTLSRSRCIPIKGYFDDGIASMSLMCPSVCTACISLKNCSSCINGSFLSLTNECVSICNIRSFIDLKLLICSACPYDC